MALTDRSNLCNNNTLLPMDAASCQVGFDRGFPGSIALSWGLVNPSAGFDRRLAGSFAGSNVAKRAKCAALRAISNANGAWSGEDYDKLRRHATHRWRTYSA